MNKKNTLTRNLVSHPIARCWRSLRFGVISTMVGLGLSLAAVGQEADLIEPPIPVMNPVPVMDPIPVMNPVPVATPDLADSNSEPNRPIATEIRFSFNAAPWREVIDWVAQEAGMALQYGEMPTGSFTYNDVSSFTPDQAINRINLFLIPQGYSLVRSGNLLAVVNLTDVRSLAQLDAIAALVYPDELLLREPYDVVKCLFRLKELKAEDAVDELSALQLMTTPKVLSQTNQLMVTDTVAKLISVRAILDAFEPSTMSNGTVVKSFKLRHVDAEDVLVVARPHLGLATDEMIGIDVSLSADPQGKFIFATGIEDKIKLIEGLVQAIDQPDANADQWQRDSILKSYLVEGGNVDLVYDVLQTLLAGQSVRLSIDEAAGSIVALADAVTQREIELTVAELQASDAAFEVIPLRSVDAVYAISLLDEMLNLTPSLDEAEAPDPNAPKIDADAANGRLFVRAKRPQIEQIKAIIADLEASTPTTGNDQLRILPMSSNQSARVLSTAAQFWRGDNAIKPVQADAGRPMVTERVPAQPEIPSENRRSPAISEKTKSPNDDVDSSPPTHRPAGVIPNSMVDPTDASDLDAADTDFLRRIGQHSLASVHRTESESETDQHHGEVSAPAGASGRDSADAPAILYQMTDQGLLLQSQDTEALNRFEELIRVVSGPTNWLTTTPINFYLKYTRSDDALRMLGKLLDGGESAKDIGEASLVNGTAGNASTFLSGLSGSFVSTAGGTLTLTIGATTVVSDSRLNRLIAQGSTADIESIEDYLRIIDKPTGVTDVLTYGQSKVMELTHIRATEAADVIRQAFGDRVVTSEKNSDSPANGAKPAAPAKPTKAAAEAASEAAVSKASQPKDLAPKMTVAVHEPSNSLIVTAPVSLLEQVQSLIRVIDSRGEQSIEVLVPTNVLAVEAALQGLLIETTSSGRTSSSRASSSRDSSSRDSSSRDSRSRSGR